MADSIRLCVADYANPAHAQALVFLLDAYARDPLTQMTLEQEDFAELGGWLRAARLPTAAVLEGGYSDDLPHLVEAFLAAWAQPPAPQ